MPLDLLPSAVIVYGINETVSVVDVQNFFKGYMLKPNHIFFCIDDDNNPEKDLHVVFENKNEAARASKERNWGLMKGVKVELQLMTGWFG